jgi:hypothetical protein
LVEADVEVQVPVYKSQGVKEPFNFTSWALGLSVKPAVCRG